MSAHHEKEKVEKTTPLPWHMADRTHLTVDTRYRSFYQSVQFYPGAPYLLVYVRASSKILSQSVIHSRTISSIIIGTYSLLPVTNNYLSFGMQPAIFIVITNRYKKFVYFHTHVNIYSFYNSVGILICA